MNGNSPGVADIFRHAGPRFRERFAGVLDAAALAIMQCIALCRTEALGGTVYRCNDCGHVHGIWRSCGNRHCPGCQGAAAHKWMLKQAGSILPVPYFHIVFTLPPAIADIALQNRKAVFGIMFRAAAETLRAISADRKRFGAKIGGTAVLHTWNQKMLWHPHLHCLVPNGGFDVGSGAWKTGNSRFFAPVKVLGSYFRHRVLKELAKAHASQELEFHGRIAHLAGRRAFARLLKKARRINWNVYAKPPFNGPEAVIRYLARYTHRVAISDSRILSYDGETVRIRCRNPVKKPGMKPTYGTLDLPVDKFIRRFLLHHIPSRFHRIRHFGILANGCRANTLKLAPKSQPPEPPQTADDEAGPTDDASASRPVCPNCGSPNSTGRTVSKRENRFPHALYPHWVWTFLHNQNPPHQRGPPSNGQPA